MYKTNLSGAALIYMRARDLIYSSSLLALKYPLRKQLSSPCAGASVATVAVIFLGGLGFLGTASDPFFSPTLSNNYI